MTKSKLNSSDTNKLQILFTVVSFIITFSEIPPLITPSIFAAPPVGTPCSGLNILYKVLLPSESWFPNSISTSGAKA